MTNPLARQITIDLITDNPNPILDWFNDLWSKLYVIGTDVYHNDGGELIYYNIVNNTKQWIFFQDNKNERFWCNYEHYWSILETKFDTNFNEIQDLTKLMVENALNNEVTTPIVFRKFISYEVENALNNEVTTPWVWIQGNCIRVENALNNEVTTPLRKWLMGMEKVENALNNEVTIPYVSFVSTLFTVENALNNEVTTPTNTFFFKTVQVENALNNEVTTPVGQNKLGSTGVENALNNEVTTPPLTPSIILSGGRECLK